MPKLSMYGENAFTFLFFEDAVKQPNGVETILANLKRFDRGTRKFRISELSAVSEPEVWLFPSFGKRHGFGEPDAIILVHDHAFWFELETDVDLVSRQPFRQLFRFHCAAQAFAGRPVRTPKGLRYCGVTVTDEGKKKNAQLQLRGYKAAGLLDALRKARSHHFVLFSVHQPRGNGDWRRNLPLEAEKMFSEWDAVVGFVNGKQDSV
jgi:hypothetical protein